MKKINSIHYGGRVLIIGGIIAVVIPVLCWLLSIWLNNSIFLLMRNSFFVLGLLIIAGFFLWLTIEFHQDKKIETYYAHHRKIKIPLNDGGYECYQCGSRQVTKTDSYCRVCGVVFEAYEDKKPQEIVGENIKPAGLNRKENEV